MYQDVLRKIDVLWLQKNEVVAAYELDQAETDISPDLLRLSDLKTLFPKKEMHLCVVAPPKRFTNIQFELSRPIFHKHNLHKRCLLISEEALLEHEEHILRWAASPAVIKDLALIGV
ncbi:hypothetical protein KSC_063220 [Ktedonobacter sp. SOSP1-52]|nr:hypothetical protein KSC_063220 [Ktedonobacter sp. SOSP1-52]